MVVSSVSSTRALHRLSSFLPSVERRTSFAIPSLGVQSAFQSEMRLNGTTIPFFPASDYGLLQPGNRCCHIGALGGQIPLQDLGMWRPNGTDGASGDAHAQG